MMCNFIGLGLKNGFAANSDMSLLLFLYAAYCSSKFAKKAMKGKLTLKEEKREKKGGEEEVKT